MDNKLIQKTESVIKDLGKQPVISDAQLNELLDILRDARKVEKDALLTMEHSVDDIICQYGNDSLEAQAASELFERITQDLANIETDLDSNRQNSVAAQDIMQKISQLDDLFKKNEDYINSLKTTINSLNEQASLSNQFMKESYAENKMHECAISEACALSIESINTNIYEFITKHKENVLAAADYHLLREKQIMAEHQMKMQELYQKLIKRYTQNKEKCVEINGFLANGKNAFRNAFRLITGQPTIDISEATQGSKIVDNITKKYEAEIEIAKSEIESRRQIIEEINYEIKETLFKWQKIQRESEMMPTFEKNIDKIVSDLEAQKHNADFLLEKENER